MPSLARRRGRSDASRRHLDVMCQAARREPTVTETLQYEELVEDFKQKLVTQLRGHGADAEYLETWVPEEDPVKSILNIVESAQAYGRDALRINFAKSTMTGDQQHQLLELIAPIGKARIVDRGRSCDIEVAIGDAG